MPPKAAPQESKPPKGSANPLTTRGNPGIDKKSLAEYGRHATLRRGGLSCAPRLAYLKHQHYSTCQDRRIRPLRGTMRHQFTLEYWRDGNWYVGRLIEVPGVFSQGKTLAELNKNIQDAYELMVTQDRPPAHCLAQGVHVELEVWA